MSTAVLSYSLPGAVLATGLSRRTLERAIATGKLRAKKSTVDANGDPAGVWVIPASALAKFIDELPDA